MWTRWLVGVLCVGGLWSCEATAVLHRSGPRQPARPEGCSFKVLTIVPLTGYAEIGAIDLDQDTGFGDSATRDLGEFKDMITKQVCRAGGDAAVAFANGKGEYIKATVLKRLPREERPEHSEALTAPPEVHPAGCRFDTQCKGERICVEGNCVAPAAPPPSAAGGGAGAPPSEAPSTR